jgi:hypothetical protein
MSYVTVQSHTHDLAKKIEAILLIRTVEGETIIKLQGGIGYATVREADKAHPGCKVKIFVTSRYTSQNNTFCKLVSKEQYLSFNYDELDNSIAETNKIRVIYQDISYAEVLSKKGVFGFVFYQTKQGEILSRPIGTETGMNPSILETLRDIIKEHPKCKLSLFEQYYGWNEMTEGVITPARLL